MTRLHWFILSGWFVGCFASVACVAFDLGLLLRIAGWLWLSAALAIAGVPAIANAVSTLSGKR